MGLIYSIVEYTIGGKTTGAHDSLRSAADKTLARALNSVHLPQYVVDVGSKFFVMEKLLNYRDHGVDIDVANCLPFAAVKTTVRQDVNVEYWKEPHFMIDAADPNNMQEL